MENEKKDFVPRMYDVLDVLKKKGYNASWYTNVWMICIHDNNEHTILNYMARTLPKQWIIKYEKGNTFNIFSPEYHDPLNGDYINDLYQWATTIDYAKDILPASNDISNDEEKKMENKESVKMTDVVDMLKKERI